MARARQFVKGNGLRGGAGRGRQRVAAAHGGAPGPHGQDEIAFFPP